MRACAVCNDSFEIPPGRRRPAKYCGQKCKDQARRIRLKEQRGTFPPCELDICERPRRTASARWCEAHYIRWYRHGDPMARVSTAREPNGLCFHCGGPARRIFCSPLCSTRDRIGASFELRSCPVCDATVTFTHRPDRIYCTQTCADTAGKARRYGLSIEQYREMCDAQSGACAVCGATDKDLHIDHCHTTGQVRGLLCQMCNMGLGHFADDPTRLKQAIAYLLIERDAG
ncbi:endonuclease VII domain-containing protein [Streptomyces sp. ME02-6979-3A]|uniref:endonuclease VII domain-containing protein n=1 Tax=Streptomyces sp. ME02-6979-3A TaxID=3028673 RepID=UPI0039F662B1